VGEGQYLGPRNTENTVNTKYYLVEDFDPDLTYQDGEVIALNPLSLHRLELNHVAYQIPEHFYDERELRSNEANFFREELSWFNRFDDFIKTRIEYCRRHDIALVHIYYNRIKYFTNAIMIQSYILHRLVEKIGRSGSIVYVKKNVERAPKKTMHDFKFDERSLSFSDLLPMICRKLNVSYAYHYFTAKRDVASIRHPSFRTHLTKVSRPAKQFAKRVLDIIRYKKWGRIVSSSDKRCPLRVLFMHAGSAHLDPIVPSFISRGVDVFTQNRKQVWHTSSLREEVSLVSDQAHSDEVEAQTKSDCQALSRNFAYEGRDLLEWINSFCGIDVSDYVLPYFQSFLEITTFDLVKEARNFEKFFRKEKIDYVITHTSSDHTTKSALIASKIAASVKTVCIQHGLDTFEDRVMHMTETDAFDYYFTSDSVSESRFKRYAEADYVSPCDVYQSPHFLKTVQTKARKRFSKARGHRKHILYIPTKLASVHTRYFNCMVYPILWYLQYQRKLFQFFGEMEREFVFIYKQPKTWTTFIDNVVIPHIRQQRYDNIMIDKRAVMDCLASSDAVLLDRPTTSFFEAHMSGLPVLSLYPHFIENMISEPSKRFFGKSLQRFSTTEEAIVKVSEFLRGKRSDYMRELPLHDDEMFQVLYDKRFRAAETQRDMRYQHASVNA